MTKPRAVVSELWADEEEAARLCGMTKEEFQRRVMAMERLGFPKVSEWNRRRFRPAIVAWWYKEVGYEGLLPTSGLINDVPEITKERIT